MPRDIWTQYTHLPIYAANIPELFIGMHLLSSRWHALVHSIHALFLQMV